jgi:hypothetical protein
MVRHEPDKFAELRKKYIEELSYPGKMLLIKHPAALAQDADLTLLAPGTPKITMR